ncbi:MAG TPA: PilC/PilY family type IV pilus protein, partial [Gammaproteobacteria bacterium]|nr:PilC/PilY family type IV pilus protein [Gammaproteobacteria bacterium]
KPSAGYTFDNYLSYAAANASRAGVVAVGANDGMLHVLDAATGNEAFAYIPSVVVQNLDNLAAIIYTHTYFVDGPLTAGDAYYGGAWHTVLVGGLGAGGQGYFAVDLTSPTVSSEANAATKVMWEFRPGSAGATNLGYGYSRPSIVKMNNGQWAAVVSNGYMSSTGAASLLILNIQTGAVIREIVVPDNTGNGLSSPTLIDTNGDFTVDVAYAGDLNGNVWKFDLSSSTPSSWAIPAGMAGKPLFQTPVSGTVRQPITTAPEVGRQSQGGYMVYVATGRLFTTSDAVDKSQQAAYGLWDNNWPTAQYPLDPALLVTQQLYSVTHAATGTSTRTASNYAVDWSSQRGWKMPLEVAGATDLDRGERVLEDLLLRDNRLQLISVNPTIPTGDNWFIQLNALTGGAPTKTIVDVDEDFILTVADNVDGDGDGVVADTARDRVVGEFQRFGLASRPVVANVGTATDTALINHLVAVSPAVVSFPDDPGVLGGHFDLDTSHLIYAFNNGNPTCDEDGLPVGCVGDVSGATTDGHVHQWDDKHDLTTIDYFTLPDGNGQPLYEIKSATNGVPSTRLFILTIANSALSPGGVLEINGASLTVTAYQALVNRFLSHTLLAGEKFPVYKLTPPTPAEATAGVQQLKSLKMSFDAFAILSGGLIPTVTGCVRGNTPGANGEYRDGALLLQALDASNLVGGYVLNAVTHRYVAASNTVDAAQGYATDGLLWESTVFWHWHGPCYGSSTWAAVYKDCITDGSGTCFDSASADKANKGKKKTPPKPKGPPGGSSPPAIVDPDHTVTNTTIAGENDVGRLFWKELVPIQ